jgi:hypothetical protein
MRRLSSSDPAFAGSAILGDLLLPICNLSAGIISYRLKSVAGVFRRIGYR